MAWTQEQLDRIKQQVALGVRRVKYGDKETEYISYDDAKKLMNDMANDIAPKTTISQRRTQGTFYSTQNRNKGWEQ